MSKDEYFINNSIQLAREVVDMLKDDGIIQTDVSPEEMLFLEILYRRDLLLSERVCKI